MSGCRSSAATASRTTISAFCGGEAGRLVTFGIRVVGRSPPVCPDDPVAIWMRVAAHQATEAAGLDLLHEPDVLVAVSGIRRREPMTETDPRPMLVAEQDHDTSVVPRARDPHLEVVGDPRDEGLPLAGSSRQRVARPPSSFKPLQVLVLVLADEPRPGDRTANPPEPGQLLLVEGHRPASRGDPPMNEGLLQTALLLAQAVPALVSIALIAHPDSLSQTACRRGAR